MELNELNELTELTVGVYTVKNADCGEWLLTVQSVTGIMCMPFNVNVDEVLISRVKAQYSVSFAEEDRKSGIVITGSLVEDITTGDITVFVDDYNYSYIDDIGKIKQIPGYYLNKYAVIPGGRDYGHGITMRDIIAHLQTNIYPSVMEDARSRK